ncbi:MAG: DUF4959 domain-containing protein [Marinifilaceae bacterium]|nr:DUF4959 domain-containing protein [Marinifilaceae bacterium]
MKYIAILLLLGSLCWFGCSDDNNVNFDTPITEDMFSFTPVEGGAIMHYTLTDRRINKVKVEYTDEYGVSVYKVADYAVDTMVLDGFNQKHDNVPVKVTFVDRNEQVSETLEFTFNTLPSTLYTFFDDVKVNSYWDGFQVIYNLDGRAEGSASVYFVGINPTTKLQDTIFLENFRLENGQNVKAYEIDESQRQESYTVMITTEDDRQRIARKQVWNGVEGVARALIPSTNFEFIDPFNKSKTMPYSTEHWKYPGALGKEYLFDGDIKGTRGAAYFQSGKATPPFTFLAGPNALNKEGNDVYFVLDIKEAAIVGEIRFYMRIQDTYAVDGDFDNEYYSKLPCNIQIFVWTGEQDYDPETNPGSKTNWKEVASFKQDPNAALEDRWYVSKDKQIVKVSTLAALEAMDPIYLSIPFPFEQTSYRFLKIQFNETYIDPYVPSYNHNNNNNVTIHEIEVYGQK